MVTPAQIPSEVYGIFSGPIDEPGAQRLINSLTTASANRGRHVHRCSNLNHNDLWFSPEDAVKYGIADEITEFSPPQGTQLYSL
jgi:hypothetical protein